MSGSLTMLGNYSCETRRKDSPSSVGRKKLRFLASHRSISVESSSHEREDTYLSDSFSPHHVPLLPLSSSHSLSHCMYCHGFSISDRMLCCLLRKVHQRSFCESNDSSLSSPSAALLEFSCELLSPKLHLLHHFHPRRCTPEEEGTTTQKKGAVINGKEEDSALPPKPCTPTIPSFTPDEVGTSLSVLVAQACPCRLPLWVPSSLFMEDRPVLFFLLSTPLLPFTWCSCTSSPSSSPSFVYSRSLRGFTDVATASPMSSSVKVTLLVLFLVASPMLHWGGAAWRCWENSPEECFLDTPTPCLFSSSSSPRVHATDTCIVSPAFRHWIRGPSTPCSLRLQSLRPWLLFFCQQHGKRRPFQQWESGFAPSPRTFSIPFSFSLSCVTARRQHLSVLFDYILRQWCAPYVASSGASSVFPLPPLLGHWYEISTPVMGEEEGSLPLEGIALLRGRPRVIIEALALSLPRTPMSGITKGEPTKRVIVHSFLNDPRTRRTPRTAPTAPNAGSSPAGARRPSRIEKACLPFTSAKKYDTGKEVGTSEEEGEESVEAYRSRVHTHWRRLLPYVPPAWWHLIAAGCGYVAREPHPPSRTDEEQDEKDGLPSPSSCSPEAQKISSIVDRLEKLLWEPFLHCTAAASSTPYRAEEAASTSLQACYDFCWREATSEHRHGDPLSSPLPGCSTNPPPQACESSASVDNREDEPLSVPSPYTNEECWWEKAERKIHFLMSLWCRVRYPETRPYRLVNEEGWSGAGAFAHDEHRAAAMGRCHGMGSVISSSFFHGHAPHEVESPPRVQGHSLQDSTCVGFSDPSLPYFVLPFFLLCRSLHTAMGESAFPSSRCISTWTPPLRVFPSSPKRTEKEEESRTRLSAMPIVSLFDNPQKRLCNVMERLEHTMSPSQERLVYCQQMAERALRCLC